MSEELIRMSAELERGFNLIKELSERIVADTISFLYPTGGRQTITLTDVWGESLPGVWMRSVDVSNDMAIIFKAAEAGAQIPPHSHEQTERLTVKSGRIFVTMDGKTVMLAEDESVYIDSGIEHAVYFAEESIVEGKLKPRNMQQEPRISPISRGV